MEIRDIVVALLMFVGVMFILIILIPQVIKKQQISGLRRKCQKRKILSLTYDDGPSEELTTELLDLLEREKVSATFYILGMKVDNNLPILKKMQARGHELASHSFAHKHAWKKLPTTIMRDVRQGCEALENMGVKVESFRPPNGKVTIFSYLYFWMRGLSVAWWTHDSTDTWANLSSIEGVVASVKRNKGGVVLMHDFNRTTMPERNQYVIDLTKALIEMAKQEDLRIVPQCEIRNEA